MKAMIVRGEYGCSTDGCLTPLAPDLTGFICGSHGSMKRGKFAHHALILFLLISVNSLSVLAEIVEARKLLAAVASKRTLASVFPVRKLRDRTGICA
jgi:hypothetical protein